jgi:hypothetical protein
MSIRIGRRWVSLLAIIAIIASLGVAPGGALAQDESARTVTMAFELTGDPAGQHTTAVGVGGSTLYGVVRLVGTADLEGQPVEVELLFSPLYQEGSGPFTGWISLTDAADDVLGLGFSGYSVKRGDVTDIEGAVGVVGGTGAYEGVTGNGQLSAVRGGDVGSNVRYDLVLDLAGMPASTVASQ